MTNLPVVEATKQFYEITNYPARSYLDNPETHFLAGNYDKILENINGLCYNQVKVLQDFSSCIYWSNKIGAENVYYWHPDKNFLKEVGKTGVNIIADKNMVPHIPQVGNLNFSKAEDTYLNLCLDRELCFVMPAWVAVAPNWKGAGWHKKSDIKKNLEDNGLKELHWIPNGTFEQMLEDGKTKDAQVDSVLVITDAKGSGYNGPHLKGLKLFQPGDIIPKVWCRQSFTSLKDAEDMLAKLTDDDMANAYQMITTKKTFSNIFIKMLKV